MIHPSPKKIGVVLVFAGLFLFYGCSTEKTGWAHRTYHSILTRFNGYFNAAEIMREAEMKIDVTLKDNYTKRLPVYKELSDKQLDLVSADMDRVLEKCTKVIRKNSIKKRGKEFTNWIDDSYFLMGKAYYYKQEEAKAFTALNLAAKKYPDQESRFEARLWLARLYTREENPDKAMKILSLIESDEESPEYLKTEIHKLRAEILIMNDNLDSAIPELEAAVSTSKDRNNRLRLTYLQGQLWKELGEMYQAILVFEKLLKMHPDYEMEFYTRIQIALASNRGSEGAENVKKVLLKMLKDEKYTEFQDQIYYALGEMAYNSNDIGDALDYLHKSAQVSDGNDYQKAKSFLRLGEIYFDQPQYQKAEANYDSCVTYMPEDYPNAEEIRILANNLKDLVAQITIIETQDSLQMVAKMSPRDRDKLINKIIRDRIAEEEQKREEERLRSEAAALASELNTNPGTGPGGGPGATGGLPGTNKWYFYNITVKESGYAEFNRKWGKRKNEDNWRRSTKDAGFEDVVNAPDNSSPEFYVNEKGDTVKIGGDWTNPAYYMKDLPLTEEQVKASNDKIIEAYYNLAVIYKEQLENTWKSIETLEELNNRFNPNVHTADSYYRLYRMYLDEEEADKATYYKNKILKEFPDSQYAQIIRDPLYLERENEDYESARRLYEKAYENYFKRGYYPQTISSCDEIIQKYPQTTIKPQAMLLRALCVGHEQGEAALRRELKKVVNEYGDTAYGQKAQELLDGLDLKDQEAKAQAEQQAKEAEMANKASTMNYEYDPSSKHNFVILIAASGSELSKIKSAISDFNTKNYRMEGLKMSAVVYSSGVQMISIKSFDNAKQAMNYQRMFVNSGSLESIVAKNPNYFIVSYTNYALFFKEKDHENYKIWADIKYKDL